MGRSRAARIASWLGFTGRWQRVVLLALLVGVSTGLAVAAFEALVVRALLESVRSAPLWLQALAPSVGLAGAAFALRYVPPGNASPATTDVYISTFHEGHRRMRLRQVPARVAAAVATLGTGGALGLEGPSLYMGAAFGAEAQRRFSRWFGRDEAKVLMVAGAAAGVAAIFKAPFTGLLFALEVPYQEDLARRALVPALIGAASSYVVFAAIAGTQPLLPVGGAPAFNFADLAGAAGIGVLAGGGARAFAALVQVVKRATSARGIASRVVVAGIVLAGLTLSAHALYHDQILTGVGYRAVQWVTDPGRTWPYVLLLLVLRPVAVAATLYGGGSGGLFIPAVVEGTVLGRLVAAWIPGAPPTLFPMVGLAAFLGAAYRTPLAGVAFVAEATGRAGYVVPALVAAAVAQLFMGRTSLSSYQQARRAGHLERRFDLPVSAAIVTDVSAVTPDTSVNDFVTKHLVGARQKSVPVTDGNRYLGMMRMSSLSDVPLESWGSVPVRDVMDEEAPVARSDWTLRAAITAMEAADVDAIAVLDDTGSLTGIVTTSEILKLDEILDTTARTAPDEASSRAT